MMRGPAPPTPMSVTLVYPSMLSLITMRCVDGLKTGSDEPEPPGAVIVSVNACVSLKPPLDARSVKPKVPTEVGVPANLPVLGSRLSPAGNEPATTDHVYDPVPPVADRIVPYAVPTVAPGSEVVVTFTAPYGTVIESAFVAVDPPLVTRTVKLEAPPAVGAPPIAPV